MNRRSIFKLFAGAVMASAMEVCGWTLPTPKPDHYIDGPCCAVTDQGAYLHYTCFGDAVRASLRKDVNVVRICPVHEYWEMVSRMCDDMERNPDKYFEEWEPRPHNHYSVMGNGHSLMIT